MTTLQRPRITEEVDPIDEAEQDVLAFDFTDDLLVGESIASAAVTVDLEDGTDATPDELKNGTHSVAGAVVYQPVKGRPAGAAYTVRAVATLAGSTRKLTKAMRIRSVRL